MFARSNALSGDLTTDHAPSAVLVAYPHKGGRPAFDAFHRDRGTLPNPLVGCNPYSRETLLLCSSCAQVYQMVLCCVAFYRLFQEKNVSEPQTNPGNFTDDPSIISFRYSLAAYSTICSELNEYCQAYVLRPRGEDTETRQPLLPVADRIRTRIADAVTCLLSMCSSLPNGFVLCGLTCFYTSFSSGQTMSFWQSRKPCVFVAKL